NGVFNNTAEINLNTLGLVLARKGKQVLHDALGALRLLVQLGNKFFHPRFKLFAFQKLSVSQNSSERVIKLVGHSGDQLTHRRHLLALKELFLGAPEIFIGFLGFIVELNLFDGGGELPANGNHDAFFRARKLPGGTAAGGQYPEHFFFTPQDHPHPCLEFFHRNNLLNNFRKPGLALMVKNLSVAGPKRFHEIRRQRKVRAISNEVAAVTISSLLHQVIPALLEQVHRGRVCGKQFNNLQHTELENLLQVKRLIERDRDIVKDIELAIATPYLIFGALHLRHIHQHALIALDSAGRIARGKAAFDYRDFLPVLAPQLVLKVANKSLTRHLIQELGAVLLVHINGLNLLHGQQFIFAGVTEHAHK